MILWWLKHNSTVWTWWQCRPARHGGYTYHSLTGRPQPLGFLKSLALFSLLRAPLSPPLKIPLPLTFDFPFSIRLDVAVSQCWNSSPPTPPDGEGNWYLCISSWCHQSEISATLESKPSHLLHLGEIHSRPDLEDNDHNEDHGCEGPDDDADDQRHCRGHSSLWFYLLHLLLILKRNKLSDLIIIISSLQWRSLQELGQHCISHCIPSLCSPERNSYRWSASGVRSEPCRKSHKNL